MQGTVYTETVVHMPPASHAHLAPYQLLLVDLADGRRVTGRMESAADPVRIGDAVQLAEATDGVMIFRRLA